MLDTLGAVRQHEAGAVSRREAMWVGDVPGMEGDQEEPLKVRSNVLPLLIITENLLVESNHIVPHFPSLVDVDHARFVTFPTIVLRAHRT